ncbi:MAG: DUF4249 family protein [Bacteroidota bacterium]
MKNLLFVIVALFALACEQEIVVDTTEVQPSVVVDAFINNLPEDQELRITLSRQFYDNRPFSGVTGVDTVYIEDVTDPSQEPYRFAQVDETRFVWERESAADSFGIIGHTYRLVVEIGELTLESFSLLDSVPTVDSLRYNYNDGDGFVDEGYDAEFFATDLIGLGDTYWIQGYKNGVFLDQPEYITTSFDGSFEESTEDGILFIPPLRSAISPFEENEAGDGIAAPFLVGDSASVAILSINRDAFLYLRSIAAQTDRQGGISELFSVPVTNLNGNITASTDERILGFFAVSSVSTGGLLLTEELARKAQEEAN